jgi:hypothetical protein
MTCRNISHNTLPKIQRVGFAHDPPPTESESRQTKPVNPRFTKNAKRFRGFGSLTCGTSRKICAVTTPRPVFDRDVTARPLVFNRPSATSRLGPLRQ